MEVGLSPERKKISPRFIERERGLLELVSSHTHVNLKQVERLSVPCP